MTANISGYTVLWNYSVFFFHVGTPIYNLFTKNVIPIRERRPWSLSQRLRHVNRMKRRDRLCHKKRRDRRRRRKRKIEHPQADEPPSKRLQLEAHPTTALSEDHPSAIATLTEGIEKLKLSPLHCKIVLLLRRCRSHGNGTTIVDGRRWRGVEQEYHGYLRKWYV